MSSDNDDFEADMRALLVKGRKIEAIKLFRERNGAGLKEAKDAVEAIAGKRQITGPSGSACLGAALVAISAEVLIQLTVSKDLKNDGGQTWKDLSVCQELPDGDQNRDYGLMAGLVRLPVRGRDILVFSNIESPEGRTGGTVWASFDGGKTWPVKRLVEKGSFAYSSLTAGRPGTPSAGWIYLMYESGGGARIARFNLAWITDGRSIP